MTAIATAILKQMYDGDLHVNTYTASGTFWPLIKKTTNFGGKNRVVVQQYSDITGRSATFSDADANVGDGAASEFTVTRNRDFAVIKTTHEELEASIGDGEQALWDYLKQQGDSAFRKITKSIHQAAWSNGGGAIGRVTNISGTTLDLVNRYDVVNFSVGDQILASDYDGTGSGTDRTGTATIASITRNNNGTATLTASANWTTAISGLVNNDYLFIEGDRGNKFKGVPAWVPYTAPGATPFFGVNRTVDIERNAGVRIDGSGLSIEDALLELDVEMSIHSDIEFDGVVFMHPRDRKALANSMGSRREIQNEVSNGTIGFKGFTIDGQLGTHTVLADNQVPQGYAWLLNKDSWEFAGLGVAPRLSTTGDELASLRVSGEDASKSRFVARGQFICTMLNSNGVVKLSTAA